MRKVAFYTLVFLAFGCQVVYAQNFRTIPFNTEAYFHESGKDLHTELSLISYSIDSINKSVSDNEIDEIIYPNRVVRKAPSANNCLYKTKQPSWLGPKVEMKKRQRSTFFNKEQDSITIYYFKPPGVSWKAYHFDTSGYIQAKVDSHKWKTHLGTPFTVRFITFQAFDSSNNKIAHPINGAQIQNSFNLGLLETVDFYNFPNDSSVYQVAGLTKTESSNSSFTFDTLTPDANEIFSFSKGDEFHYRIKRQSASIDTTLIEYEKRLVIDKELSDTSDTIHYKFFRSRELRQMDSKNSTIIGDTVLKVDTIVKNYSIKKYSFLNKMNKEFFKNGLFGDGYMKTRLTSNYNQVFLKQPMDHFIYESMTNCLKDSVSPYPIHIYGNRLGRVYYKNLLGKSSEYDTVEKELIYFQKGLETWGDPHEFTNIVGIHDRTHELNGIRVYPNPFESDITVDWTHINTSKPYSNFIVEIYNVTGQKIWEQSVDYSKMKFSISPERWNNGLYFLKVTDTKSGGSFVKKIMRK